METGKFNSNVHKLSIYRRKKSSEQNGNKELIQMLFFRSPVKLQDIKNGTQINGIILLQKACSNLETKLKHAKHMKQSLFYLIFPLKSYQLCPLSAHYYSGKMQNNQKSPVGSMSKDLENTLCEELQELGLIFIVKTTLSGSASQKSLNRYQHGPMKEE